MAVGPATASSSQIAANRQRLSGENGDPDRTAEASALTFMLHPPAGTRTRSSGVDRLTHATNSGRRKIPSDDALSERSDSRCWQRRWCVGVDRDDLVVVRLKRDRIAALLLHCVRRPPCCDGAP